MKKIIYIFCCVLFPLIGYSANIPQWQIEMNERVHEMEELQRKNGTAPKDISTTKVAFPKTYDDLSYAERAQFVSTDMQQYKDMNTYQDLNVKTVEEWCKDGDHANTLECVKYRCSPGGPEASSVGCTTWRCQDSKYYAAHKTECDTNAVCKDDANSSQCMNYKCHNTAEKDTEGCKQWLCENDSEYKKQNKALCKKYEQQTGGGASGGTQQNHRVFKI